MTNTASNEAPEAPPEAPPEEGPDTAGMKTAPSLVLLNTGDGKGKSTAAFGVILRAVALDWGVAVVQFLKSDDWNTGEEKVCRERLGVDWWALGEGFTWDSHNITRDEAVAQEAWRYAREVINAGEHRLVVLDEVTYPVTWGWIDADEVVETLAGRPEKVSVVMTGRDAPDALVDAADTVTDMNKRKHAFDAGVIAKKGLDY